MYMIFCINTTRDVSRLSQQFRNISRGIYAKYQYKSCYNLYKLDLKIKTALRKNALTCWPREYNRTES